MNMRDIINLVEAADESQVAEAAYRQYLDRDLVSHLNAFCEWLLGDAMNLTNDAGERFSPAPYYASMVALGRLIPPKLTSPTMFRGVGFQTDPGLIQPGRIKTSKKAFQSWTTNYDVAAEFADEFGGIPFPVVYHAEVAQNRRSIVVDVVEVANYVQQHRNDIPRSAEFLNVLTNYTEQEEVILKGSIVNVSKVERL